MVFFLAIRNFLLGLLTSLLGGLNRPLELELVSRPEGTCAGPGPYSILVSQILSGAVVKFDTRSGERTTVVPDQGNSGRQAWGLWSYNGAIFVVCACVFVCIVLCRCSCLFWSAQSPQ